MKRPETLRKVKAEEISVTLTLGELDSIVNSLQYVLANSDYTVDEREDMKSSLRKIDEAING